MKRKHLILFAIIIPFAGMAQKESQPEEETTRFFHYAAASSSENGKSTLYVSGVVHVNFFNEYLPFADSIISSEMERQFIARLQNDYGDEKAFTFQGYAMNQNQAEVAKTYKAVLADFKKKGYKIVTVKKFAYD